MTQRLEGIGQQDCLYTAPRADVITQVQQVADATLDTLTTTASTTAALIGRITERDCEDVDLKKMQQGASFLYTKLEGTYPFLSEGVAINQNMMVSQDHCLPSLPSGLVINGYLHIKECTALTTLPDDIVIHDDLIIEGCPALTHLPSNLVIHGKKWFRTP